MKNINPAEKFVFRSIKPPQQQHRFEIMPKTTSENKNPPPHTKKTHNKYPNNPVSPATTTNERPNPLPTTTKHESTVTRGNKRTISETPRCQI